MLVVILVSRAGKTRCRFHTPLMTVMEIPPSDAAILVFGIKAYRRYFEALSRDVHQVQTLKKKACGHACYQGDIDF